MSRNRIWNASKLRKLSALIGKPVKWATTNGGHGHSVEVVALDGEEFCVWQGKVEPTGHAWTAHEDGHWSRSD